jgi:hypothetical protein
MEAIVVFSAPYAHRPHGAHQPLHRALGHFDVLAAHLVPDLARAIEARTAIMDTYDLWTHCVVTTRTGRPLAWIDKARCVFVIRGRGDRQFAADRLDTQFLAVPWRGCRPIRWRGVEADQLARFGQG